jgi:hypothetical protein
VAYLIVAFSFALAGGLVGRLKGSSFFVWFLISGVLPVLGLVAALLYRTEHDELRRQCPGCGKIVELEFPEIAIEPESATSAR